MQVLTHERLPLSINNFLHFPHSIRLNPSLMLPSFLLAFVRRRLLSFRDRNDSKHLKENVFHGFEHQTGHAK
jgi:hypothetical protein